MALKEKLEKLKRLNDENSFPDWFNFKEVGEVTVLDLKQTIIEGWFIDYQEKRLRNFDLIPTIQIVPCIWEY